MSMWFMGKTDLALVIQCHLLWHQVWHHIVHYLAPNKEPIWLIQFKMCGFPFRFFGIYALKWKFNPILRFIYMCTTFICLYTSLLGLYQSLVFVKSCQFWTFGWRGSRRFAVVWPLVIPLSFCLVYRSLGHLIMKLWWSCGCRLCHLWPEASWNQSYEWAIIGNFDILWPSEVESAGFLLQKL